MIPVPFDDHDIVEISYVGRVKQTGEIFDLTDEEVAEEENVDTQNMDLGPVRILIGEDYVLDGLEEAIKEMDVGEERTVDVPKEKGFGSRSSDNIETIAKREFDEHDVTPRRGMPVEIDGRRGKVLSSASGRVKVDFNHPLAGKDLEYDVEVLDEIEDLEEQVKAVIDFHMSLEYSVAIEDRDVTVTVEDDIPEEGREQLEDEIKKLEDVDTVTVEAAEESD